MATVAVPFYLLSRLYFDRDFACRLIDVELNDGRIYRRLHLCENSYIANGIDGTEGQDALSFRSFDIANVQRHSFAYGRLGTF